MSQATIKIIITKISIPLNGDFEGELLCETSCPILITAKELCPGEMNKLWHRIFLSLFKNIFMPEVAGGQYVPDQYAGSQSETTDYLIAENESDAKSIFQMAKVRLLNINLWHELCGFLSTAFQLTDSLGQPVKRMPVESDYIRIDIPGPGTKVGRGFDWVRIERLRQLTLDSNQELFVMQVRPSAYPQSGEKDVAHFFKNSATSSFMIVRETLQVTAAIYGRNEVPNTETSDFIDNIRNQVVGSSGAIGLSIMQWKSLVSSLLDKKNERMDT